MRRIDISDLTDPALDDFVRLTDVALRKKLDAERGLYLAESPKVIARSIAAGHTPRALLLVEAWIDTVMPLLEPFPDVPVYVGDDQQLESLTGFHMHRGAIASIERPALPSVAEVLAGARTVLVLDGIVDHTNIGAAFRNAAGLGADAVLVTASSADPLYRRSIRVSMGTVLQVPWTRLPDWPEGAEILHDQGFHIAALALDERAVSLQHFAEERPERVALVLGSEGHGLGRAALRSADSTVIIPMLHGVDSLNVAAASAVALYAVTGEPPQGDHPNGDVCGAPAQPGNGVDA